MRTPDYYKKQVIRHEWVMDSSEAAITARDIADLIRYASREMERLGIDTSHDDSWHIMPRDEEIVIWVEESE